MGIPAGNLAPPSVPRPAFPRKRWWPVRLATALLVSSGEMTALIFRYRRIVWATTRLELAKRYAGSAFGKAWIILQPTLLLSIYLFVYLVVFKVRFPGYGRLDYVLYVFCGLTPYLGFMEASTTGCTVLRQNLHLVKNVMLPIELLPVRAVMVSLVSQLVSMGMVILLAGLNQSLSLHLAWLPLALLLQVMMLLGLVWILSAVGVVLPDIAYFVSLAVTFLLFISPIGFKPEMVPAPLRFVVSVNPVYYLTEVYRHSILLGRWPPPTVLVVYVGLCLGVFAAGCAFFRKFKDVLVDYE